MNRAGAEVHHASGSLRIKDGATVEAALTTFQLQMHSSKYQFTLKQEKHMHQKCQTHSNFSPKCPSSAHCHDGCFPYIHADSERWCQDNFPKMHSDHMQWVQLMINKPDEDNRQFTWNLLKGHIMKTEAFGRVRLAHISAAARFNISSTWQSEEEETQTGGEHDRCPRHLHTPVRKGARSPGWPMLQSLINHASLASSTQSTGDPLE